MKSIQRSVNNDPFGLGFHGKEGKKVEVKREGQSNGSETAYEGQLPLIKDSSIVQRGGRLPKQKSHSKKQTDLELGNLVEGEDLIEITNMRNGGQENCTEQGIEDSKSQKTGILEESKNMEMKLPHMKTEDVEKEVPRRPFGVKQEGVQIGDIAKDSSALPRSNLVPFEVRAPNTQPAGVEAKSRKGSIALPKTASKGIKKRSPETAGKSSKRTREDSKLCQGDGVGQVRIREPSTTSMPPVSPTASQRALFNEAYCMQMMNFTNTFTYSFFQLHPVYAAQNAKLLASGKKIGKKRPRPKPTKPPDG